MTENDAPRAWPPVALALWFIVGQLFLIGVNVNGIKTALDARVCAAPVPMPTRAIASNQAALVAQQERLAALVRDGWQVRP